MDHVHEMIQSNPQPPLVDRRALGACIEACYDCAQSCITCAGACLGESEDLQKLVRCIRLDQDCAEICTVTGNVLSRGTQPDRDVVAQQLAVCKLVCERCAAECDRHAKHHDHCRVCADACVRCAEACRHVLDLLGSNRIAKAKH